MPDHPYPAEPQANSSGGGDARRTIIFLHLPSTGGTTLRAILERQYGPSAVLGLWALRGEPLERYLALPEAEKRSLRAISVHGGYGFHELVPNPATYVTLLRSPVQRVLSTYYHILRDPHHPHRQRLVEEKMDLAAFVCSGLSKVGSDNGQTRLLSGEPNAGDGVPFRGCTRGMLENAKTNLREHFAVVGLTEAYDESLMLMCRVFGWLRPYYRRGNVGVNRPRNAPLAAEVRALIEEYNSLDIELYQYAAGLFQEQVRRQGPAFPMAVALFRLLNRPRLQALVRRAGLAY